MVFGRRKSWKFSLKITYPDGLSSVAEIHSNRCPRNHRCPCVGICPAGAVSQKGFDAPEIDDTKCTGCGLCMRMCPYGVFSLDFQETGSPAFQA